MKVKAVELWIFDWGMLDLELRGAQLQWRTNVNPFGTTKFSDCVGIRASRRNRQVLGLARNDCNHGNYETRIDSRVDSNIIIPPREFQLQLYDEPQIEQNGLRIINPAITSGGFLSRGAK
ncbi:unnamed protein product [Nesidiocoris tenuis]|uniref:Uncharacterized protein n=1 Tax=Nesidiocoris tenuis TaxID=355587 RepID=A0A6H5GK81_9HEMI|nr:unnamed protein product [Nesidiocoris tenuis]CAB0004229.1 unnamed protein product [Nesidiocoris tenuis]